MFFWSTNEAFSIIDALLKLILVITGSALIICFCHKLTNYKKSRRYKSGSLTSTLADNQLLEVRQFDPRAGPLGAATNQAHLLAYDPYNTIRTFGCLTNADSGLHQLAPNFAYQYNAGLVPDLEALAASGQASQLQVDPAQSSSTNLIANPVFSSASPFNASQPLDESELCPSYEEALAAAAAEQAQQQQQQQLSEDAAGEAASEDAPEQPDADE